MKLPVDERREACLFKSVSEIMAQLEDLTGPAILDARHVAEGLNVSLPDEAEMLQAITEAKGRSQSLPA